MNQLSCTISSLTPIVTGDHEHRNTELLATGILGSLRYQYWLLKAMQAWQKKQSYPHCSAELPPAGSKNFTEELRKAGPVVWLFGATNWKKMFRLEIAEAAQGEQQSCSSRSNSKAPWQWTFKLTFRQDRTSPIFAELAQENGTSLEKELHSLMAFVHQHGWLGAAPQNGLGWVTVQNDGLERISLPENNPVFAAKEVELPASCVAKLLATLRDFYVPKLADAESKMRKVEAARREYWKDKEWKNQHSRQTRYDRSLHLLNQKNKEFPVGYEIRRWLREQMFPVAHYRNEQEKYFGNQDHAGFVHVTHPDVQSDGSWRLRLRFAVRPDRDKNGAITRLNPNHLDLAPQLWLDYCEKLLKQEKLS